MKRFEVTVFLRGVPDKFIQMLLQIVISMYFQVVISMYFQVVISMYFQVVISSSNNLATNSNHVSTTYFQVHVLVRSNTFNGNDVGALRKKGIESNITYYCGSC